MSDTTWASSAAVRATMRANKGRDTQPELRLRRALHARGYRYYVNRRPLADLRRTADLVFPRYKVAVLVDGCFWHGCPEHHTVARTNADYWHDKVRRNIARDRDTDSRLLDAGWQVVRIWEHEPVTAAIRMVEAALQARAAVWGISSRSTAVGTAAGATRNDAAPPLHPSDQRPNPS